MISCGPVDIVPSQGDHIPAFYEISQGWPVYWSNYTGGLDTLEEFTEWWNSTVDFSLTGIDRESGQVVGAGWLSNITPGYWAEIHVFKRKDYLNPEMVAAIMVHGLPVLFKEFELEKIIGLVRPDNQACLDMLRMIGLKEDGVIRHHDKVDGVWQDYILVTLLKEEATNVR